MSSVNKTEIQIFQNTFILQQNFEVNGRLNVLHLFNRIKPIAVISVFSYAINCRLRPACIVLLLNYIFLFDDLFVFWLPTIKAIILGGVLFDLILFIYF